MHYFMHSLPLKLLNDSGILTSGTNIFKKLATSDNGFSGILIVKDRSTGVLLYLVNELVYRTFLWKSEVLYQVGLI
jgi:hypothetical protein